MAEPHAQARNARACVTRDQDAWRYCGGETRTGPRARTWEAGRGRAGGRQDSRRADARVSRGGWVGRPARRLVRPIGLGDGSMDLSP
jgi:hypothetical protein